MHASPIRIRLHDVAREMARPVGAVAAALRRHVIPWFDDAAAAWERWRFDRQPLRLLTPVAQETDRGHAGDAIRWIGPIRIRGRTREALFCHPTSRIQYRVSATGSVRLSADCSLVPAVWSKNMGGVEFELRAGDEATGWTSTRSLRAVPGRSWLDRRWKRLTIDLPPARRDGEITLSVELATRLPPGASSAHAWAIWGEPAIETRRTWHERRRLARAFLERAQRGGLRAIPGLLREVRTRDEQALQYRRWLARHTPTADDLAAMAAAVERLGYRPRISVVTPVYNTDPRWLRACIESVRCQVYPDWELCLCDDASSSAATRAVLAECEDDPKIRITRLAQNSQISAASNAALATATGEFVALLDHDDELSPEALFDIVRFLNACRAADMIYSDEDKLDADGARCDPYFKPDWSPEHFQSSMYTNHLMVLRRSLVEELGGFRVGFEGAQDYDLVLRLMERTSRIHHVPKILYHWRKIPSSVASAAAAKPWAMDAGRRALSDYVARTAHAAEVLPGPSPGQYRMKFGIGGEPLVSIVIPTDGRRRWVGSRELNLLVNCVHSIVAKTTYPHYEVVVVDNGTLPADTLGFLGTVPHRRVGYEVVGRFNFADKINFCARQARGEHLLLMNDDLEVIAPEWLTAMLEYSQQERIGAVGPKLLFPDGRVQHIGIVLGVNGMAAHAFHMASASSAGYASSALAVRNYSAVTGGCMMTRRAVFEAFNGFDERFRFDFSDVDYCLRLRRAGYRIVFTPYAELYHHESATESGRTWDPVEVEEMRRRWPLEYERDPYYNPNLTRDFCDYRLRL